MQRLFTTVLVLSLAACGGKSSSGDTTPVDNGPPPIAKKLSLSWGIQAATVDGDKGADLFLALQDETGKVTSHELGRYKGECGVVTPEPSMNALTALRCNHGGTGTELQVVTQGGSAIIVLKLGVDQGITPDPMAREEVKRIAVTLGVAITVDPVQSTTGAPGVR